MKKWSTTYWVLLTTVVVCIGSARAEDPVSKNNPDAYRLDLNFSIGKAIVKVPANQKASLQKIANDLSAYPYAKLIVEGHTDSTGSDEANLKLSEQRAEAVREYFISNYNIAGRRITAKGYGETAPIASNDTAAGRRKNRRIMATVIRLDSPQTGGNQNL